MVVADLLMRACVCCSYPAGRLPFQSYSFLAHTYWEASAQVPQGRLLFSQPTGRTLGQPAQRTAWHGVGRQYALCHADGGNGNSKEGNMQD
jgi:hypothetical protein